MIDIIRNYWDAILYGLYITFQICLASWVLGIFLGVLLGILRFKKHVFNSFFQFLSLIIGGIPVLVFLFWITDLLAPNGLSAILVLQRPIVFLPEIHQDIFLTVLRKPGETRWWFQGHDV